MHVWYAGSLTALVSTHVWYAGSLTARTAQLLCFACCCADSPTGVCVRFMLCAACFAEDDESAAAQAPVVAPSKRQGPVPAPSHQPFTNPPAPGGAHPYQWVKSYITNIKSITEVRGIDHLQFRIALVISKIGMLLSISVYRWNGKPCSVSCWNGREME